MIDTKSETQAYSGLLPEDAKCLQCNYPLRGLPEINCPECGLPFDPGNPTSYHTPTLRSWLIRYGQPPGKRWIGVLLAAVLFFLASLSDPFLEPPVCIWTAALSFLLVLLALDWSLRLAIRIFLGGGSKAHQRHRWLWAPLMFAFIATPFLYPWPAYLRFQLNKPDFENAIQNIATLQTKTPIRVGSYMIRSTSVQSDGSIFLSVYTDRARAHGFWYIPTNPDTLQSNCIIEHRLNANWYIGGKLHFN